MFDHYIFGVSFAQNNTKYLWSPNEQKKIFVPSYFQQNLLPTLMGHYTNKCGKVDFDHKLLNKFLFLLFGGKSISKTIIPGKLKV